MKNFKIIPLLVAIILLTSACAIPYLSRPQTKPITSFAECAKLYPVMESYPRQCRVPDGPLFAEILTPAEKEKTVPPAACKNSCGNGNCDEVVCLSTDCPCPETNNNCPADCPATTTPIVGGDKDEHGCIGSAGYSWCAAKNKCLRTWEEACPDSPVVVEIKKLFAAKYNKAVADIKIVINQQADNYIRGSVNLSGGEGAGGIFLAAKVNNAWQIVHDGNGGISCKLKTDYGFPDAMLTDCY